MAKLQIITSIKNQLTISITLGLILLIPINSNGKIKAQQPNSKLQPSGTNLTMHKTIKYIPIQINGSGNIDTVKNNVDMDAHYPGGKAAWKLFFTKNFRYTEDAFKNGINGLVLVRFIILQNGSINNAKIISGIDKANDQEVLRVVKIMPDWIPVLIDGKPVDVPFVLSVPLHQDSPSELVSATYNNEEILTKTLDQPPLFPGGYNAMLKFLHDHTQYPTVAQAAGIQGTAYVRFVVRSTGKLTNVTINKGIGIGCDEEAVRVVQRMPDWIPGRDKGKAVSCYITIPIKWQLQANNNKLIPGSF